MKNLLLKVPETTDIDALPVEIVELIQAVRGQWIWYPKKIDGFGLLDCFVLDGFDSQVLMMVPGWELLGAWQWDCITPYRPAYTDSEGVEHADINPCVVLLPVAAEALQYLPDHVVYDDDGNIVSSVAPTEWYEAVQWSGWPPRRTF